MKESFHAYWLMLIYFHQYLAVLEKEKWCWPSLKSSGKPSSKSLLSFFFSIYFTFRKNPWLSKVGLAASLCCTDEKSFQPRTKKRKTRRCPNVVSGFTKDLKFKEKDWQHFVSCSHCLRFLRIVQKFNAEGKHKKKNIRTWFHFVDVRLIFLGTTLNQLKIF